MEIDFWRKWAPKSDDSKGGQFFVFYGVKGGISYLWDGFFQQGPVFAEDKHQGPAPQQGEPLGAQDAAEPGEPGDAAEPGGAQGGAEAASAGQNEPSARGEGRIRGIFSIESQVGYP